MTMTEARPATTEVVTPIKPSEALRLGRLLYPMRWAGEPFGPSGKSACALGAMHAGWGGDWFIGFDDDGDNAREDFYSRTLDRLTDLGIAQPTTNIGEMLFDKAHNAGGDGDAAVLAFLEERGL